MKSDNLDIGRILHLKAEIRNLKLDDPIRRGNVLAWTVQFACGNFCNPGNYSGNRGWELLLIADKFDNGRTPEQLRQSFQNTRSVITGWLGGQILGTARILRWHLQRIPGRRVDGVWLPPTGYRKRNDRPSLERACLAACLFAVR